MKVKFYKLRALLLIYIVRTLAFILRVEMPPILSVAAIIKKGSKVLFLDFNYLKGYGLPGGHVRGGETLEEALKREVFEETGLSVKKAEVFSSYPSDYKGMSQIVVAFLVEAVGNLKSSEEGKLYWLEPRKIVGNLAYEDNEKIIKALLRR